MFTSEGTIFKINCADLNSLTNISSKASKNFILFFILGNCRKHEKSLRQCIFKARYSYHGTSNRTLDTYECKLFFRI